MARPGLPKKYAKMGFAAGWRAYRAAKNKAKSALRKVSRRKKSTKKTSTKKRTVTRRKPAMAKKAKKAAPRRRRQRWTTSQAGNIALNSGVIAGSAILSTVAINNIPMVKDLRSWQKALIQGLVAIGVISFTPRRMVWTKKFFGGAAVGSALNFFLPYFPGAFRLQGRSRPLSAEEMKHLTMGMPYKISGAGGKHMGVPATFNTMGVPATLAGKRFNKRGGRAYAGQY